MKVEKGDIIVLKRNLTKNTYYGEKLFYSGMRLSNDLPLKVIDTYCNGTKFFVHETTYVYTIEMISKVIKPIPISIPKLDGGSTPDQYSIPSGAIDLQDLIEYRKMDFALGNIFKACYRLGIKDNKKLYELNKIKWFVERLIKQAEKHPHEKIGNFKL